MNIYATTSIIKQSEGKAAFRSVRRISANNITQARKAASRIWSNRAGAAEEDLLAVYLVEQGGDGFIVHERQIDDSAWRASRAIGKQPKQIEACIERLGNLPPCPPPPENLTINGYEYHRGNYVGDL